MRNDFSTMEDLTEEECVKVFDQMGKPRFWIMKGECLFRAATLLHAQQEQDGLPRSVKNPKTQKWEIVFNSGMPSLTNPCWYMSAATIEIVLKAIILQEHPEYLQNGQLDKKLHTHDLNKLAKIGDVMLTKEDEDFCLVGSRSLEDWGKYPIPKRTRPASSSVLSPNSPDVFINFYNRLLKKYNEKSDSK